MGWWAAQGWRSALYPFDAEGAPNTLGENAS